MSRLERVRRREAEVREAARARQPVKIGWFFAEERGAVVYPPPERCRSAETSKVHAKSASRCPAILNMESRYFVIRCPFDLHLRFIRGEKGEPGVRNMLGDRSPVRRSKLSKLVHMVGESEWRYPDKPTVQVSLPYTFIADEPVFVAQIDAFMDYRKIRLPGTIFGGRFPIDVWPRPMMWAFEWCDTDQDLILKRGDPWFYVTFEASPANRPIQLFEAEFTPELQRYVNDLSGAVNFVSQSFSLFDAARQRRPKTLLQKKQ